MAKTSTSENWFEILERSVSRAHGPSTLQRRSALLRRLKICSVVAVFCHNGILIEAIPHRFVLTKESIMKRGARSERMSTVSIIAGHCKVLYILSRGDEDVS